MANAPRCKNKDCKGHMYIDKAVADDNGIQCFGKKRERMVWLVQRQRGEDGGMDMAEDG
jgi:hypothetical protein